jgi:hypothetical protein
MATPIKNLSLKASFNVDEESCDFFIELEVVNTTIKIRNILNLKTVFIIISLSEFSIEIKL